MDGHDDEIKENLASPTNSQKTGNLLHLSWFSSLFLKCLWAFLFLSISTPLCLDSSGFDCFVQLGKAALWLKYMLFSKDFSFRVLGIDFSMVLCISVSDDEEIDYSIKPEFYDSDLDVKDELWVQKKRKGRASDAVLSCPACFTTLCLECQR